MRLLVMCGPTLNEWQTKVLAPFWSSDRHAVCGCLIDCRPAKPLLQRLIHNLRRGRGAYVLVMAVELLMRKRRATSDTAVEMSRRGVPVLKTPDPYSQTTVDWIRSVNPDAMLLVGGFGIVKNPLLDITPHGILSFHHGDMRKYRGMPPAFWELYNGEKEIGVTVQILGAGLDSGKIVLERKIEIDPCDNLASLRKKIFAADVARMMFEAVERLEAENGAICEPETLGRVYTMPNLSQWLLLHLKILLRRLRCRLARLS